MDSIHVWFPRSSFAYISQLFQIFDWISGRVEAEVKLTGPDVPCDLLLGYQQYQRQGFVRSRVTLKTFSTLGADRT